MAYALWRVRDGEGRTRSRIRSNRAEMRPVDTENGFHAKIRILSESVSCRRKIRGGGPKRTTPSPRCGRGRFAEAEACLCGSGRMRLRRYRNGCFPYGGFGLRCRLQLFGYAMPVAVGRGCHAVLFAEEFDEVRGVGKGACGADFGVYDKVALKRKRAIDDIRNFCYIGIDTSKDWKEINEDLKDEIYYYFNSKYAREGYMTDNNESFSLLDDTDRGKKSSAEILFKYMRVGDSDVIGASGAPKDNIKHLQGAVRLIRRGTTDSNATLSLLNVFCLLALKVGNNKNLMNELDKSYIEGYQELKNEIKNHDDFASCISRFKTNLNIHNRNLAIDEDIKHLDDLEIIAELGYHNSWMDIFTNKYIK